MTQSQPNDDFWVIIPAGGAGTRLWPLSRSSAPKFLHDLTGSGRSLLQQTVDRLVDLAAPERVMVVTGAAHAEAVAGQVELGEGNLIVEPSPRSTMPAIGLAAALVEARDPEAVIGSFASDHVIADVPAFQACVTEALAAARAGELVTIGIEPTYPATGFGYIHEGERLDVEGAPTARRVDRFVEKPPRETAEQYLATGEFRWNAGMFVVKARVLLDLLAQWHPDLAQGLRAIAARPETLGSAWPSLTSITIDHAVAEPAADAGQVAVVPGVFDWDDVGDFAALTGLLADAAGHPGLKVLGPDEDVLAVDSTGLVAPGTGRLVVTLGVEDIVVVDTPDAVLITTRERAQDVKTVVDALKRDREELT